MLPSSVDTHEWPLKVSPRMANLRLLGKSAMSDLRDAYMTSARELAMEPAEENESESFRPLISL